jgi:ABC-type transport system involved in multi-copper enzyme maturation permease subunit
VNGTLAVARYTLIEMSRRRVLLVFFILGFLGIIAVAVGLKILSSVFAQGETSGASAPALELQFAAFITGVLADFGLLVAYGIGMTAIYHDLESGAAVSIFSKPVSRLAFAVGKILAGIVGLVVIVGLLAIETRLVILLFGGGYEDVITEQVLAVVANTLIVMLVVLALTTWMNNIVAAIVAFVYANALTGIVQQLHNFVASNLIDNDIVKAVINIVYWLFPHPLTSNIPEALVRGQATRGGGSASTTFAIAASGPGDVAWWAFLVLLFSGLVYYSVRRRQV